MEEREANHGGIEEDSSDEEGSTMTAARRCAGRPSGALADSEIFVRSELRGKGSLTCGA